MFRDKEVKDYYRLVTKTFKAGTQGRNPKYVTGEQACKGFTSLPRIPRKFNPKSKHVLRAGDIWLAQHITSA